MKTVRTPEQKERRAELARARYKLRTDEQRAAENARNIRWRARNPEHSKQWREGYRAKAVARRYGITEAYAEQLLAITHCESCGDELKPGSDGHAIDHNHEFGHVRGVLCAPCNKGLGHFRDDPARMAKALAYLLTHGEDFVR